QADGNHISAELSYNRRHQVTTIAYDRKVGETWERAATGVRGYHDNHPEKVQVTSWWKGQAGAADQRLEYLVHHYDALGRLYYEARTARRFENGTLVLHPTFTYSTNYSYDQGSQIKDEQSVPQAGEPEASSYLPDAAGNRTGAAIQLAPGNRL